MPSSNVRDDLPTYYRVHLLREVAATVIRAAGTVRRRGPRRLPPEACRPTPLRPVPSTTEAVREPRALPPSRHQPYAEAEAHTEQLRQQLRRNRHPDH